MTVRRWSAVGFVAAALVVGVASVAWACTEQSYLKDVVSPAGGLPAGSTVQVSGAGFAGAGPGQTPVSIRWGEPDGPQLATIDGPAFSVPVRIPDSARPGLHYIYGVQTVNGATYRQAANTVEVAGAEDTTDAPTPTPGTAQTPAPAAGPATEVAPVATAGPAAPAPATATSRRTAPRAAVGSSRAPTGGQATAVAVAPAAGQEPEAAPAVDAAPLSSRASVSADLWGGLASGDTRRAGPSLADDARASDRGAPVSAGTAVLLGIGLVLMTTAVGVGRRQRARAGSPTPPAA